MMCGCRLATQEPPSLRISHTSVSECSMTHSGSNRPRL